MITTQGKLLIFLWLFSERGSFSLGNAVNRIRFIVEEDVLTGLQMYSFHFSRIRRGVWIPRTSWEALWYGVIQWAGITNENAIDFILPNANNFGCNLYSEVDLFTGGTASIPGCGGSAVTVEQKFIVSEPRILIPEEQKAYCDRVVASIAQGNIRCFILKQTLTEIPSENRNLNEGKMYNLNVDAELNMDDDGTSSPDEVIVEAMSTAEFQQAVSNYIQMDVTFDSPVIVTSSPSQSPSFQPLDIFTIVTSGIFQELFPNHSSVYTYAGFRSAVENWNQNNLDKQIFASNDEPSVRHQLAAFMGHVLHESGGLQQTRESSQCEIFNEANGVGYCNPNGQSSGDYTDPYCSTGCGECAPVGYTDGKGYNANKLYFGRGPLQLSHSYNYFDAGEAVGTDYCALPDLVATNEVHGWASALWFWTSSIGSTGTTCKDYVARRSFGGTLKTINGGFECPSSSYGEGYFEAVVSRLNDYCRAATVFEVEALLEMDDCELLSNTLNNCIQSGSCASCGVWADVTFEPTSCECE